MRSEKPKKNLNKTKSSDKDNVLEKPSEPVSLFLNPTVSGSAAINFLGHDPALAEREAAALFDASKKNKKE